MMEDPPLGEVATPPLRGGAMQRSPGRDPVGPEGGFPLRTLRLLS
jgi:hypothetical protein